LILEFSSCFLSFAPELHMLWLQLSEQSVSCLLLEYENLINKRVGNVSYDNSTVKSWEVLFQVRWTIVMVREWIGVCYLCWNFVRDDFPTYVIANSLRVAKKIKCHFIVIVDILYDLRQAALELHMISFRFEHKFEHIQFKKYHLKAADLHFANFLVILNLRCLLCNCCLVGFYNTFCITRIGITFFVIFLRNKPFKLTLTEVFVSKFSPIEVVVNFCRDCHAL